MTKKFTKEDINSFIKKADEGEYGEESRLIKHSLSFLKQVMYEQLGEPFIHGVGGEKNEHGFYPTLFVCQIFGVNDFASYKFDKFHSMGGW